MSAIVDSSLKLADLSKWIDESPSNVGRGPEALTWHRVAKVSEEAGEVIEAFIGLTGGNPRKGVCRSTDDVVKELLDTAVSALTAVEHLSSNGGASLVLMLDHIDGLVHRAGI